MTEDRRKSRLMRFMVIELSCRLAEQQWHVFEGILTQEVVDHEMKLFGRAYIPASYVKYIESGGARVIPIR